MVMFVAAVDFALSPSVTVKDSVHEKGAVAPLVSIVVVAPGPAVIPGMMMSFNIC